MLMLVNANQDSCSGFPPHLIGLHYSLFENLHSESQMGSGASPLSQNDGSCVTLKGCKLTVTGPVSQCSQIPLLCKRASCSYLEIVSVLNSECLAKAKNYYFPANNEGFAVTGLGECGIYIAVWLLKYITNILQINYEHHQTWTEVNMNFFLLLRVWLWFDQSSHSWITKNKNKNNNKT